MREKVLLLLGADGALGNGMISYFLKQDYDSIYLSGRNEFPFEEDERIKCIFSDSLDRPDAASRLFEQIEVNHDSLLFVFSAIGGFSAGQPVGETSIDVWERMVSMNLLTAAAVLPHFVRKVKHGAGGAICFTSALSAFRNEEDRAAYAASKAALNQLIVSSAPELKKESIGIFAVAPYLINTPATQEWMNEEAIELAVTPSEVAATVHHLFDQYSVLSGNIIRIEHRFRID